jgi:hypothetical protein
MADQKWLPELKLLPVFDLQTGAVTAKFHTLSEPMAVGDCLIRAGATVTFYPNGAVTFKGQTHTNSPTDLWHQRFMFRNADGALLHTGPSIFPMMLNFDGPEMSDTNYHAWTANGAVPTWVFNQLVFIDWGAEC